MKTLDEVIAELEYELAYNNGEMKPVTADALHYLKAYKDDKDDLTALRAYWAEQQENPPLTWDELKQMEGKPVWVEADYFEKGWFLVDASFVDIWVTGYDCAEHQLREEDMGVSWQAYRKERE